mmetsp:Transcript_21643/g.10115  ORF Transcript_21643/g.10115 Transcript_21643/m.10115 type:complete len:155 (-) Transcript_21643:508-972(-)
MRTFLAFDIDGNLRKELYELISRYKNYRNIKWINKENLHMTLLFIGDTRHEDLRKLDKLFAKLFDRLSQFQIFKPKIWIRVETDSIALQTIKDLRRNLNVQDYKVKNNRLKLYITLGKIKGFLPQDFFAQILTEKIYHSPSRINKIVFYESVLK